MPENKIDANGEVLPSVGILSVVYTSNHFAPLVACDLSDNSVEEFKWNENRTELVSKGKVSLQDRIQASAKGLTVYEILDRALRGDVAAQRQFNPDAAVDNSREPLDYSDMPETLAEAADILHDAPIILAKQAELLGKKAADDVVNKEGVK